MNQDELMRDAIQTAMLDAGTIQRLARLAVDVACHADEGSTFAARLNNDEQFRLDLWQAVDALASRVGRIVDRLDHAADRPSLRAVQS